MKAGTELDVLIAEHVMGLPKRNWNVDDCMCSECGIQARWCGERSWCTNCSEWRYAPYVEYSLYISYAWGVFEKIGEDHYIEVQRTENTNNVYPGRYLCSISSNTNNIYVQEYADTGPLAICRAALKAKGVAI